MSSFFQFSAAPPVNQITIPTEQREQNRLIANQMMNAMALGYYYLFMANTAFETEDDIDDQQTIINDQFSFLVTNNGYVDLLGNSSQILNTDTINIIESLRFNAHQSLTSQVSASRKVVDIIIKNNSLLPLTFAYYGDLDSYDTIYDLNNLSSAANLVGDFKVLTNED